MKLCILIDYDNLLETHKSSGILNVVTRAILQIPLSASTLRGTCDVRVYGGWFEGANMTQMAQDVTVALQQEFPIVVRAPLAQQLLPFATNAELAVSLLEEPSHHLFDTFRRKARPRNIRVQTQATIGCIEPTCPLPLVRKLLKTGNCPLPSCVITADDLVYRHEQKIVDTMLTCDLIYSSTLDYDLVILVSSDDDFLPPVRTALLRGKRVVRFHPQSTTKRAVFPRGGAQLLEMDL